MFFAERKSHHIAEVRCQKRPPDRQQTDRTEHITGYANDCDKALLAEGFWARIGSNSASAVMPFVDWRVQILLFVFPLAAIEASIWTTRRSLNDAGAWPIIAGSVCATAGDSQNQYQAHGC
ncbi:hypothetical protein [Brucella intermedia]|uniref:hypothetical protein n=1 Tax=Brucella intermedia TaxID=94625 RepID=UPI00124C5D20|nr:hypothetical protein [Brucella intermedia]KAB2716155.1 hypothetical protein F9K75_15895 [Brucella intermedia]